MAVAPETPRLRIAVVAACPLPARRGTPVRVQRLSESLAARGHHVELITYHICEEYEVLPMRVHRIRARRIGRMPAGPTLRKLCLYDPLLALKVREVVRRGAFDLVYAHHVEALLASAPACRQFRVPLVYDAHTLLGSELAAYAPRPLRPFVARVGRWLDAHVPRLADSIITVTPDIRDRLVDEHGFDPRRVTVVSNGVESGHFARPEEMRSGDGERIDEAGHSAPISGDGARLIYSGTLAPYQDIDLLLSAFAEARQHRPDLRLCLAVSSSFAQYVPQAEALGITDAIDVVRDDYDALPDRLAQSDIAVLPRTRCDGIPQKLLNYMAAGKPVVASEGSAKVLAHERTGLVVPDGDVREFARAVVRLADNPAWAANLGRLGQRLVRRRYSWETAAAQVEGVCAGAVA